MTSENLINIKHYDEGNHQSGWSWWKIGAVVGFACGVVAILTGIALTFVIWLSEADVINSSLQTLTNDLFYAVFPLFFFGAYCLDKIEDSLQKKAHNKLK